MRGGAIRRGQRDGGGGSWCGGCGGGVAVGAAGRWDSFLRLCVWSLRNCRRVPQRSRRSVRRCGAFQRRGHRSLQRSRRSAPLRQGFLQRSRRSLRWNGRLQTHSRRSALHSGALLWPSHRNERRSGRVRQYPAGGLKAWFQARNGPPADIASPAPGQYPDGHGNQGDSSEAGTTMPKVSGAPGAPARPCQRGASVQMSTSEGRIRRGS